MRLSVADFGWANQAIDLAARVEDFGYHRYWLGEHHSPFQTPNPLLLSTLIAGTTSRIRVGTAGVCLRYHSPLAVAEDAALITDLFDGRFDLGVCNGRAATPAGAAALLDERQGDLSGQFSHRAAELSALLGTAVPNGHALAGLEPRRAYPRVVPYWVMGVGLGTAELAAKLGSSFCFSEYHNRSLVDGPGHVRQFRAGFRPGNHGEDPGAAVLLAGISTEDTAVADQLTPLLEAATGQPHAQTGKPGCFLVGSGAQWREHLAATSARYGEDVDLVILDLFFLIGHRDEDLAMRFSMYEQIANHCL